MLGQHRPRTAGEAGPPGRGRGLAPREPRAQPHLPQARSALREEGQNKTPQFPHLSNGDKED